MFKINIKLFGIPFFGEKRNNVNRLHSVQRVYVDCFSFLNIDIFWLIVKCPKHGIVSSGWQCIEQSVPETVAVYIYLLFKLINFRMHRHKLYKGRLHTKNTHTVI